MAKRSKNQGENVQGVETNAQDLVNKIVIEFMKEQKRKRRFRWFMRFLLLCLLCLGIYSVSSDLVQEAQLKSKPHVGLIDINGEIGDEQASNADDFAKSLDEAYKNQSLKALIVRINSPGGSPVQADYMYNLIRFYHEKHPTIPVYAVCMDLCASAAYYVAVATDAIYANPSSLVGSIGVLYNGFGFNDGMQKLGITRRLYTAGKNKAFLDPFSPVDALQVQRIQEMLNAIHQIFIEKVKNGRGKKLTNNPDIFSGLVWTGIQAKDLGLVDDFGSAAQVARSKASLEQMIDYSIKRTIFDRFNKSIHSAFVGTVPTASMNRLLF